MKKTQNYKLVRTLFGLSFVATASFVSGDPVKDDEAKDEKTPYTRENNSWIELSGKVTEANPDSFKLDYGKGSILVEMDDYDWYAEGYEIFKSDDVKVFGRVDADQGEMRSIEAGSVWVEALDTFFFANSDDEEDFLVYFSGKYPERSLGGTIYDIKGREFTLQTSDGSSVQIETRELAENPFDDEGFVKLKKGDRVWVTGEFDKGYLERDEIVAKTLTKLSATQ